MLPAWLLKIKEEKNLFVLINLTNLSQGFLAPLFR